MPSGIYPRTEYHSKRLKESNAHYWLGKKNPKNSGENHGQWKGGSRYWWSRTILKRDNYTCQICGLRDKEVVEADHIKPRSKYPELQQSLDNGWTLCANCHRRKTVRDRNEHA